MTEVQERQEWYEAEEEDGEEELEDDGGHSRMFKRTSLLREEDLDLSVVSIAPSVEQVRFLKFHFEAGSCWLVLKILKDTTF